MANLDSADEKLDYIADLSKLNCLKKKGFASVHILKQVSLGMYGWLKTKSKLY